MSEEMISKLNPVLQRPVFFMTSASGMKRDHRRVQPGQKFLGPMSIFVRQIKSRCKIGNRQTKLLDRLAVPLRVNKVNQTKLKGQTVFLCLLNSLVNNPIVSQRILPKPPTRWARSGATR